MQGVSLKNKMGENVQHEGGEGGGARANNVCRGGAQA